jgi:hypothetical protein
VEAAAEKAFAHGEEVEGAGFDVVEEGIEAAEFGRVEDDVLALVFGLAGEDGTEAAGGAEEGVGAPGFAEDEAGAGFHDAGEFLDGVGVLEGVVEGGAGEDEFEGFVGEHIEAGGIGGDALDAAGDAGCGGAAEAEFDGFGGEVEEGDLGALGGHPDAEVGGSAAVVEDAASGEGVFEEGVDGGAVEAAAFEEGVVGVGEVGVEDGAIKAQGVIGEGEEGVVLPVVEVAFLFRR